MKGLRARVMVALAVAAIVPTVLTGALAVRRARHDVEREVTRGHLALVRALGAGLDATLQDAQRALALVGAAWAADPSASPDSTRRLLTRLRRELPLLRRVAVLDPDGHVLAGDPLQIDVFAAAGGYGGFVSDTVFEDGRPVVLLAAQARARTGELTGYLAAELDLGFVGQSLRAARLPDGATLFVVDGEGRLIASSDPRATPGGASLRGDHPSVDLALAAADDGSVEQGGVLGAYRNLSSFQTTRGVAWALVLEQPTFAAYALASATRRDTLLAGALVLLAALGVGWLSARALVRPLAQLTSRVDALATDDRPAAREDATSMRRLDAHLAAAPGEIGLLARRFAEMSRRLEEREKLRTALARGERLASVGALAAGVAHEVNNPLTTILGYANLLLEDRPEGHPDREALLLVADEARRVQGIVRRLLDFSRAESETGGRGPTDVNALCQRAAALLEPTLRTRRHVLETSLQEALPEPSVDGRRLEQVLVNLLQNAAHAMEKPGTIALRTRHAGDAIAIEIADDGPGIPPDLIERIFEPFFTTKGPGVGTGLGLAVSQQIVLDHGGRIEVESKLGSGAVFRVILPISS